MRIKNAFNLLLSNLKLVFYDLFYRLVIAAVLVGIGAIFVVPFVEELKASSEYLGLMASVKDFLASYFNGNSGIAADADILRTNAIDFVQMFTSKIAAQPGVAVGFFVLVILFTFFNGMFNYASGVAMDSYMSSLSHVSYHRAMLKNFGRGFWYQFLSAVLGFVWTLVLLAICWLVFDLFVGGINIYALPISIFLFVLGKSVLNSFLSSYMPSVVTEKRPVFNALGRSFKMGFKNFGILFIQYVALSLFAMYINASFAVFTLGAGLLLTIPGTCVCHSIVKLVNYYYFTKRKYYINYDHIVVPVELRGEDEKFLNGIKL